MMGMSQFQVSAVLIMTLRAIAQLSNSFFIKINLEVISSVILSFKKNQTTELLKFDSGFLKSPVCFRPIEPMDSFCQRGALQSPHWHRPWSCQGSQILGDYGQIKRPKYPISHPKWVADGFYDFPDRRIFSPFQEPSSITMIPAPSEIPLFVMWAQKNTRIEYRGVKNC